MNIAKFLIMEVIKDLLKGMLFFYNEVAIYLLLGFAAAGLLYVIFPESIVRRHLGKRSFFSVVKSTLFGIPLPLCSCGVIPVAASLKRNGASKGAAISFLISTPQIGADSFMITYSLLGWIFAVFRIGAAFITSALVGFFVNIIDRGEDRRPDTNGSAPAANGSAGERLKSIFSHIEYEILGPIANSLVAGLVIAGLIGVLVPDGFFERYFDNTFLSMLLMMVIGIPMYVCATASTPIAASLVFKGISPGAALVFLLTGPATNAITISTVMRTLGKKTAAIYLAGIGLVSLLLGLGLNLLVAEFGLKQIILHHHTEMLPMWLKMTGSIILGFMVIWYYFRIKVISKIQKGSDKTMADKTNLKVRGMTCMHCVNNVKKAIESVEGASNADVNLQSGEALFDVTDPGQVESVKTAIQQAGYDT
jgi:uncharacterized membrane protein YraQ (UPF0718 family)/copper chaperone CopZ